LWKLLFAAFVCQTLQPGTDSQLVFENVDVEGHSALVDDSQLVPVQQHPTVLAAHGAGSAAGV
jgi:hypothetical protein